MVRNPRYSIFFTRTTNREHPMSQLALNGHIILIRAAFLQSLTCTSIVQLALMLSVLDIAS